jgi:serine/threonine-protein kinase
MLKAGDRVDDKYTVLRLIGDGGMGTVYEARHERLGTRVALKFLHEDIAERPGLTERFLQEAKLAATIVSHPSSPCPFQTSRYAHRQNPH